MDAELISRTKPRLRGVSHQFACFAALSAGLVLVAFAPTSRAAVSSGVYAATLVLLFGVSALYHVPTWTPEARRRMRRVDHASIFVLIAGTYTPVVILALPPGTAAHVLPLVWAGATVGVLQSLFWVDAPKPLAAGLYLLFAWALLPYISEIHQNSPATMVLILLGGAFYSTGAIIYALRRPDPAPKVFGYHEIFHALVILASICHFSAVASLVSASS